MIVKYESLENIIKLLRKTVARVGRSLTQVGYLEKDISQMKTWVIEYKKK